MSFPSLAPHRVRLWHVGWLIAAACTGDIGVADHDVGGISPARPSGGPVGTGTGGTTPVGPGTGTAGPTPPADATSQPSKTVFACDPSKPSASPPRIWRLTDDQYTAAVRALDPSLKSATFSNPFSGADSPERYKNLSGAFAMPAAILDRAFAVAEELAPRIAAPTMAANPCTAKPDDGCLRTVIETLGARAFRRPLTAEESTRFLTLSEAQLAAGTARALETAVQALLTSPHFLFRVELGQGPAAGPGRRRLSPYETASALAFSLTDAPPDAALMADATNGKLSTAEEIRAHARRLLTGVERSPTMLRFLQEYLLYPVATEVVKDKKHAPNHAPADLVSDTDAFVREALRERKGFLNTLLTAPWGYARKSTLASYNLLAGSIASTTPVRVTFPSGQRAGLLTQPSFLSAFSEPEHTDPIRRGKFIAQSLLCLGLPDQPPAAVPPLPETTNATMREKLSVHVNSAPGCRACHDIMDPLGLGLEAYDDTGRFRTMELNKPVNSSGSVAGTSEIDGPFNGAVELSQKLASSETVRQCFVRHSFRFWMGRNETELDSCSLRAAFDTTRAADGDPVELLVALFASDSFLVRISP